MTTLEHLQKIFAEALAGLTAQPMKFALMLGPSQKPEFGHYQLNAAMALAKERGEKPRDTAQAIINRLSNRAPFADLEIAGPGFINIRLSDEYLASRLVPLLTDPRLGLPTLDTPKTLVIDFSSPNVAKPMHVGHLRSTVIGDSLARMYSALGWTVHRINHLGDWGTQFGMLIVGWRNDSLKLQAEQTAKSNDLVDVLSSLYVLIRKQIKAERGEDGKQQSPTEEAARAETAKLQNGDPANRLLWKQFITASMEVINRTYARLDVQFHYFTGESFYHELMPVMVDRLVALGLAQDSEGAITVFFPDTSDKRDSQGNAAALLPPTIIRKRDGSFLYATSDLACIVYRVQHFRPDVICYVVGHPQELHFKQIFEISRRLGYTEVDLVHASFGSVLDPKTGQPLGARKGDAAGLEPLLDEAVAKARKHVDEQSKKLNESERAEIAEIVGVGAVKYADLSQLRVNDYKYSLDKMLAMDGNTATYLQYAHARIS